MPKDKNNIEEQLDRFTEELIDNIINTKPSEILKEIEDDFGDPDHEANEFLAILKKSKIDIGKIKLELAKEELKGAEN